MSIPCSAVCDVRGTEFRGWPRVRRGSTLVIAIVVMTVVIAGLASWLRMVVLQHRQLGEREWQQQSECLAISAFERAEQRWRLDGNYTGEDWIVPLDNDATPSGHVTIRLEPQSDPAIVRVIAVARVPDHPVHRAQRTLSRDLRIGVDSVSQSLEVKP